MIRWAKRCNTVRLAQIASEDSCADIMTKCLTGMLFRRHRAKELGLTPPERGVSATHTHTRRRQETSEYTFENLNIVVTTIIGERFAGAISNSPIKLLVQ